MRTIFSILRRLKKDRRGTIAVVFALSIVPLVGFVGVSIDYARLVHMKTTLQAAADSAAISGAAANFGSTAQQLPPDDPYDVATKYFTNAWLPPAIITDQIIAPDHATFSTETVTVSATAQVATSFLAIWHSQIPVSVTAIAKVGVPPLVTNPFPFALPSCLFTTDPNYWNSKTNEPVTNAQITLYSTYDNNIPDPCLAGQWTTFLNNSSGSNSANLVKGYLSGSAPCNCTIAANQSNISFYNQDGAEASIYKAANDYIQPGTTVVIPVVTAVTPGTDQPVTQYAAFKFVSADQGKKTITGYLLPGFNAPGVSGFGGTYSGVDHVILEQ